MPVTATPPGHLLARRRAVLISLACAIAAGGLVCWLTKEAPPRQGRVQTEITATALQDPDTLEAGAAPQGENLPAIEEGAPSPRSSDQPPVLELESGVLPWEPTAGAIARSANSDTAKARALLSEALRAPAEALQDLTHKAVELLPDAGYSEVALPLVTSPGTHGAMEAVLFADLLKRPDAIALPALLAIARTPTHPYRASARDALAVLVGGDYVKDWPQWEQAVQRALARPQ